MKPWFSAPERQDAVQQAIEAWLGTPYFANNASRGHGVGCVEFVHEVWVEAGAIPRLSLPRYQLDWAHHATSSQLVNFLLNDPALRGRLVFVPILGQHLPGDLLALRSGRLDHHLAVIGKWEKVAHAVEDHGVIMHNLDEPKFAHRVLYSLRLLEP